MRASIAATCLVVSLATGLASTVVIAQVGTRPTQQDPDTKVYWGPRVEGETLEYTTGGTTYRGYLARNANDDTPRPAVLVVHEWWGLDDYAKARADQLAALGFTALAVDMYGEGRVASHPDEAGEFSQQIMQDWPATRARLEAAISALEDHPAVADGGMAAIGYCFGGGVVMNMALSGMPIEAAISFHGSPTQAVRNPRPFEGAVQIHNGAADPLVEREELVSMAATLDGQGAEVELINYHSATHGFTNPAADRLAETFEMPLGYDASADASSWQSTLLLLDRTLND